MKIYIVTTEAFPNGMAATNRIICYAKALKMAGLGVEVINFQRTENFGRVNRNTMSLGVAEGISFRYIGGTTLRHKNPFIRKFNDWRDQRETITYLKKNLSKGDIIFLYCGGDVDFSLKLIEIANKKNAYIIRDLCEYPYGTGAETKNAMFKRKVSLEIQFPRLDGFVCISEPLIELARKYGSPNARYVKVPILVDWKRYYMEDKSSEAEIPYIFHSGTLYEQKDGILGMIEAFGKAVSRLDGNIQFVLTGTLGQSPHKLEIERLIRQYNIADKVTFTGYLSTDDLQDKLSKASLVIINKYQTQQNHFCFSTKLGEYLAAAKPVIITQVGEAMNYLENGKNAIVVPPEDNDALAEAIIDAFNNRDKIKQIGRNGQVVCKNNFDYRIQSAILVDFLRSLTSNF